MSQMFTAIRQAHNQEKGNWFSVTILKMPFLVWVLSAGEAKWTLFSKNCGCLYGLSVGFLTNCVKDYPHLTKHRTLPGKRGNHPGHLPTTFKGKFISWCQWDKGLQLGHIRDTSKSLGRKILGSEVLWEYGLWKAPTYSLETRRTCECPRCSISGSGRLERALNSH